MINAISGHTYYTYFTFTRDYEDTRKFHLLAIFLLAFPLPVQRLDAPLPSQELQIHVRKAITNSIIIQSSPLLQHNMS